MLTAQSDWQELKSRNVNRKSRHTMVFGCENFNLKLFFDFLMSLKISKIKY